MRKTATAALAALSLFVTTAATAQTLSPQTLPPVEAFGNLPLVSPPLLSPDGKHFATVEPVSGRPSAVIYDATATPGSKPVIVTAGTDVIIDSVQWAKNDRLLLFVKHSYAPTLDRLRTWMRTASVNLQGNDFARLMHNMPAYQNNTYVADVIDLNVDDPDFILMGIYNVIAHDQAERNTLIKKKTDDTFRYDVAKVDVHTGKATVLKTGTYETNGWISDGKGDPVIQFTHTVKPLRDHVIVKRKGRWEEIGEYNAEQDLGSGVVGLTEDGTALVRLAWDTSPTNAPALTIATTKDIDTGAEKTLFSSPRFDIDSTIEDEWTGRVIGARYVADKGETHYFDPQRQALQTGLDAAFPGRSVRITSWDRAKDKVVFAVDGPQQPVSYYLLDRTTHQTQFLAAGYPALQEKDLGAVRPYPYKARDGLDIPAYLTLPPGKTAKNLPVVVLPHGGPDTRDSIRFDWMAQFLANRGYVVLQPNFRGSSGYGHHFTEAGYGQWGLKMQDDLTDGVQKLIADGIADPKRICIVGASYGGYAALAGAAFTPDIYACAISLAGVSDLPVQLESVTRDSGPNAKTASFWLSRMGEDMAKLGKHSPARYADQVKAPILLLHGKNDTTVRLEQSKIMYDALQQAHKKVEFVTFEGEDHYLKLASTRIQILKEMERFLKQNIGN